MSPIYRAFLDFDSTNPGIWEYYQSFAWDAIDRGKTKIGSKAIIERIRWEIWIRTESVDGFKINNNYTAYYARKWNRENPGHAYFEIRRLRWDDEDDGIEIEMP